MDPGEGGEITRLLGSLRSGDHAAEHQLLDLVQSELHRMARRYMRSERATHTLQPTALVNEVYLRLFGGQAPELKDRTHFFAVAAQAMRRILIDYARAAQARKRGGEMQRVDLESPLLFSEDNADEMLALDRALNRLQQLDGRQSRIVELRFFVGLDEEEIAQALGVSSRTVKREWRVARAWLYAELSTPAAADA